MGEHKGMRERSWRCARASRTDLAWKCGACCCFHCAGTGKGSRMKWAANAPRPESMPLFALPGLAWPVWELGWEGSELSWVVEDRVWGRCGGVGSKKNRKDRGRGASSSRRESFGEGCNGRRIQTLKRSRCRACAFRLGLGSTNRSGSIDRSIDARALLMSFGGRGSSRPPN